MKWVGYLPGEEEFKKYTANTAVTHHSKKTYALVEPDLPFQIQIETQTKGPSFDIKSIGYDDFDGQLKHNASAHSKINKKTGELFVFGTDMDRPICNYSLINRERKLINQV